LGIGDWGLGPIPNPQSPIPNPQSPDFLLNEIRLKNNKKCIKIINLIFFFYKIKIFNNH